MKIKNNKSWIAGIFTAVASSLCCITPVLVLVGGASGLASSFSWIEPYRPYLIAATILIFAFLWYQKLKPQKQVDCACETDNTKSFWRSKSFLGMVTVIAALLMAFPYYASVFYPKPQQTKVIVVDKSSLRTIQLNISGMDCEACTGEINRVLSKKDGVIKANTSYKNANAKVEFDDSRISADSIANAVNAIGFKVTSITNNK